MKELFSNGKGMAKVMLMFFTFILGIAIGGVVTGLIPLSLREALLTSGLFIGANIFAILVFGVSSVLLSALMKGLQIIIQPLSVFNEDMQDIFDFAIPFIISMWVLLFSFLAFFSFSGIIALSLRDSLLAASAVIGSVLLATLSGYVIILLVKEPFIKFIFNPISSLLAHFGVVFNLGTSTALVILAGGFGLAIWMSISAYWHTGESYGSWFIDFLQNFSTEIAGAIVIVIIAEIGVNRRTERDKIANELASGLIDVSKEALRRARFTKMLSNGTFDGVVIKNGDLSHLDLSHSSIQRADLTDTTLTESNLSHSQLDFTNFNGAQADKCNFHKADLTRAKLSIQALDANFSNATLTLALVSDAKLAGADFSQIVGLRANFKKSILKNANFHNADLRFAQFKGADVTGADFTGANISHANFDDCIGLDSAEFTSIEGK